MSRYIDADKLKSEFDYEHIDMNKTAAFIHHCHILEIIDQQPTADVRKNVKGEWISKMYECSRENYDQVFCCSVCGVSNDWRRTNFCPNCGADMRPITTLSKKCGN